MAKNKNRLDALPSAGVQALIERLQEQGVQEGHTRAEELVSEANRRADWLLGQAREEAERVRSRAQREAKQLLQAGHESLKTAARDVVLEVKETLIHRFTREIGELVREEMADPQFLQALILEVAGQVREEGSIDEAREIEIHLPKDAIGIDELRRHPERLTEGTLTHFVVEVAGEMLRKGAVLRPGELDRHGVRIRMVDEQVDVELSDQAVSEMLLQHLQPRFRALLDGIVR